MNLLETPWDVLSPLIIWALGLLTIRYIGKRLGSTPRRSMLLYSWHTFICFAYLYYSLSNSADSIQYYLAAQEGLPKFRWGTNAVTYSNYILVTSLHLSYLSCFLVYNAIGSIGFIAFDALIRSLPYLSNPFNLNLANLLIFLPSISFWSSAIGKDAIAFTAAILALRASLSLSSRWPLAAVSLLLMFLVRPHIGALLLISFFFVLNVSFFGKKTFFTNLVILIVIIFASASLFPLAIQYSGLEGDLSTDAIQSYVEERQGLNQEGAGGIDISSMQLPMQLFSYLLRPLFFDGISFLTIIASAENLLIFSIFLLSVRHFSRGWRPVMNTPTMFLIFYSFTAWIILASTTANLGIALRQKWMFLPFLIYLAMSLSPRQVRNIQGPLL